MSEEIVPTTSIMSYMNQDVDRYSVWVYDDGENFKVYDEKKPNTVEIWFEFHRFSYLYWKMLEQECVDCYKYTNYYNFNKVKLFMLKRMISATNIDGVSIEYQPNGILSDQSYSDIMKIHPRILRMLMNKVNVFPKSLSKSEEKELEKQCSILFGKGDGIQDPHPYISVYCNLASFWEKFGINYFDLMRLPRDLFKMLKQVMSLETSNKSASFSQMKNQNANAVKNAKKDHHKQVRF